MDSDPACPGANGLRLAQHAVWIDTREQALQLYGLRRFSRLLLRARRGGGLQIERTELLHVMLVPGREPLDAEPSDVLPPARCQWRHHPVKLDRAQLAGLWVLGQHQHGMLQELRQRRAHLQVITGTV